MVAADHRRDGARDRARLGARPRRRDRAGRPAARRPAPAPARGQGLPARSRPSARSENFFRKGNLIALRELALRRTAERVDAQMESYRRDEGIAEPWAVRRAHPGRASATRRAALRLIRAARRMASGLQGRVDRGARRDARPSCAGPADAPRLHRRRAWLRRGAGRRDRRSCSGTRVADEILAFARERNVTRIVVGKPVAPALAERCSGSLVETLVRAERRHRRLRHQRRAGRRAARAASTAPAPAERLAHYAAAPSAWWRSRPAVACAHVPALRAGEPRHGLPARRDGAWPLWLGRGAGDLGRRS